MVAMSTTLPALMKGSASALVKKKSTSGSVPVSKSVSTLAFHSSLELLDLVAGGLFIALHGVLVVLTVAVVTAVGGDHVQRHRGGFASAGFVPAAGQQAQKHHSGEKQGK